SVGGASGSTLAGAIIASGLMAIHHTAESLTMQNPGSAVMDPVQWSVLRQSFAMVFGSAALFSAVSFVVAMRMDDASLRTSLKSTAAE
ncbi:hypothetical protein, partial [Escherichia coli]|uniref:hypothetical protein n=1 Tax=Escherichia coli TaxID=562 RepID=UPI0019546A36